MRGEKKSRCCEVLRCEAWKIVIADEIDNSAVAAAPS